jgi:hypothetical protein
MSSKKRGRGFIFPFEKLEVWQLAVDLANNQLNLFNQRKRSLKWIKNPRLRPKTRRELMRKRSIHASM